MANINRILAEKQPQMINPVEAKASWQAFRVANGWSPRAPMMSTEVSKFHKDDSVVIMGYVLAQAYSATVVHDGRVTKVNTCPFSTEACRDGCVGKNGNGAYQKTREARKLKVDFLLADPSAALTLAATEIDIAYALHGDRLRVRMDTLSDIRWEEIAPWLFTDRPHIRFYDYTKDWNRVTPSNYVLTRSASERTKDSDIVSTVSSGSNVAVVFSTKKLDDLPATWHGLTVVDGDKTDNRADDPQGVIVGLRAKGRMRTDKHGMVRVAS